MNTGNQLSRIAKHVWTEPKFVAQVQWMSQHESIAQQIERQVGRDAMMQFIAGGGWPDPDQRIILTEPPQEPDWDWWEPRYDTPERRQQSRDRKAGL